MSWIYLIDNWVREKIGDDFFGKCATVTTKIVSAPVDLQALILYNIFPIKSRHNEEYYNNTKPPASGCSHGTAYRMLAVATLIYLGLTTSIAASNEDDLRVIEQITARATQYRRRRHEKGQNDTSVFFGLFQSGDLNFWNKNVRVGADVMNVVEYWKMRSSCAWSQKFYGHLNQQQRLSKRKRNEIRKNQLKEAIHQSMFGDLQSMVDNPKMFDENEDKRIRSEALKQLKSHEQN
eukprot:jgi/Bigna1/86256/estExt_fgenesh1_pg.C_90130